MDALSVADDVEIEVADWIVRVGIDIMIGDDVALVVNV